MSIEFNEPKIERWRAIETLPDLHKTLLAWTPTFKRIDDGDFELEKPPLTFDEVVSMLADNPELLQPLHDFLTDGPGGDRNYAYAAAKRDKLAWAVLFKIAAERH